MDSKQRNRARYVLILICLGAGALVASLYWTQIHKGDFYADKAKQQYVKPAAMLFDRGSIFFSSKDGTNPAAARVGSGYLIYMNPTLITDADGAYAALSQYTKMDKDEFMQKASKVGDKYEELMHKVDTETGVSVAGLKIPGIGATRENWRTYPGGALSSHVLGLIGESSDGSVEGRYGLERSYEQTLKRTGIASGVSIFAQLFSGLKDSVFGAEEVKEGDIITTIEPSVQGYLEKTLEKISTEWKPDEVGAVIMNPMTGEIVAMAALPSYDPNNLSKVKNVSVFSNPLVERVYELGSIVKPLTMAVGLDSGAITVNSTYDDTGTMVLSGKKIANFDGRARGVVPMQEVLSQSLNVGAATIALKVGKDDFAKYFSSFGIGSKTGIDQPNESQGITKNLETGRDIEIATAAYGQGIAVSPVSMTRALSILGNGGYLVKPHLVKEIDYSDGTKKVIAPEIVGPVIKKQTSEEVTRMLVQVVDKALKNGKIKMDHYSIAAKTGTAQIADHSKGGYYPDRYLHSFFGYFPAYNPEFIVFIYQIHPKGAQYASETLVDPFSEVTKFLINYYNITPDR